MAEFLRVNGSHSPLLSLPLCTLLPVLRLFLIRHLEAYTTATLGFYLNTLAALKWLEGILTTTGSRLRSPSSSNTTTLKPEGWTCWTLGVHKPPTHIQGNPLTPPDHLSIMLVPAYKPHWSTNRGCSLSTSTLGTLSEASRRDHINIQEYAKTVTSNTAQCTEDVTVGKNFTTCGNQKTWKTIEVCSLLTHHCSQHSVLTHLDSKDNHARLLYIDFIYFFSFGRGIRKELNGKPRY